MIYFFLAFVLFFYINNPISSSICKLPIRSEIYNCTFKNTNKVSIISIIVVLGPVQTSNELKNCLGWPTQTSKFISRPQFTFTMYNGPQCLPVKKNYNNLCFRFVLHMRSSTLETKPLHSRNSHVSHSTQISWFKRRPFHVGLVPERLDVWTGP